MQRCGVESPSGEKSNKLVANLTRMAQKVYLANCVNWVGIFNLLRDVIVK